MKLAKPKPADQSVMRYQKVLLPEVEQRSSELDPQLMQKEKSSKEMKPQVQEWFQQL